MQRNRNPKLSRLFLRVLNLPGIVLFLPALLVFITTSIVTIPTLVTCISTVVLFVPTIPLFIPTLILFVRCGSTRSSCVVLHIGQCLRMKFVVDWVVITVIHEQFIALADITPGANLDESG